ncbi:hypothetical protein E2C01_003018 [Portunus trituberculatus]|uniref:Uncharacterized protein n=1 Tax=Portunus trituberculatus TaxID=210409 RepID=A0A5B7CMG4_PORTR|nr:hypothetical protein [Portunus trituberculatus]
MKIFKEVSYVLTWRKFGSLTSTCKTEDLQKVALQASTKSQWLSSCFTTVNSSIPKVGSSPQVSKVFSCLFLIKKKANGCGSPLFVKKRIFHSDVSTAAECGVTKFGGEGISVCGAREEKDYPRDLKFQNNYRWSESNSVGKKTALIHIDTQLAPLATPFLLQTLTKPPITHFELD